VQLAKLLSTKMAPSKVFNKKVASLKSAFDKSAHSKLQLITVAPINLALLISAREKSMLCKRWPEKSAFAKSRPTCFFERRPGVPGAGDVAFAGAGDVAFAGAGDVALAGAGDVAFVGAGDVALAGAGDVALPLLDPTDAFSARSSGEPIFPLRLTHLLVFGLRISSSLHIFNFFAGGICLAGDLHLHLAFVVGLGVGADFCRIFGSLSVSDFMYSSMIASAVQLPQLT
jgi:hypothetical protein